MHLARRQHQDRQADHLPRTHEQGVLGLDVGVGERVGRRDLDLTQQPEVTAVASAVERMRRDDLVDDVEPRVVVVDEEAEHRVVAASEVADPDREPHRGERGEHGSSSVDAVGVGHEHLVDVVGSFETQRGAHERHRSADETGDRRRSDGLERVDAPQRRVDRPQQRAQRGPGGRLARVPVLDVGADQAIGEQPRVLRRCTELAGDARHRARVGRHEPARRGLPRDRVGHGVVDQLADRFARPVEELE